ncbi:MAG: hypothetical protein ACTHLT_07380 [Devosia sp.]
MIENKIAILAKLRDQAPAQADDLVARYGRLAGACRVEVNQGRARRPRQYRGLHRLSTSVACGETAAR